MCGICGFNWNDKALLKNMANKMNHRGPDQEGYYNNNLASLGHKRLSIIDLSHKGNQPMFNKDKTFCIVFNGEIYNFKELKDKYCKDYPFSSKTDTEVILAMYEKFGEECVKYFNGMWGFCIYDIKNNRFFCSRDRLGIKPFYYCFKEGKFIFSSEIKAIFEHDIKTKINTNAISSYLKYRYVLGDETFFVGIKKLVPGHNLIFDGQINLKQYWDIEQKELIRSFNESKKFVNEELIKSIDYRVISDVPIGAILSGGLDSSYISAIMAKKSKQKINTYTVKFKEEGFDETSYAKLVSDMYNTIHNELLINKEDYLSSMKEYLKYKDEPIGVPNEVALYLLFKEIKKTATVVLAGEGSDEIFGGYGKIFRSPFDYLKEIIVKEDINFLDFFMNNYGYFNDEDMKILKPEFNFNFKEYFKNFLEKCPRDYYNKISYIFLKIHLPGLLLRTDVSSMANSIESRVPFLDHNLIQLVYSLPFEYKNKFKDIESVKKSIDVEFKEISEEYDIPKYILKQISKDILPEEIINRKKQGFPLPLDKWFGENYIEKMKNILLNEKNNIANFVSVERLKNWINQDNKEKGKKIWMLYSLEIWLEEIKRRFRGKIII